MAIVDVAFRQSFSNLNKYEIKNEKNHAESYI